MKRKPSKRFEHINDLVDRVAPTMPSAAYVAVVLVAWRHTRNMHFRVSAKQFATQACISLRHARYVLDDLERGKVIHLVSDRKGTLPKVYRFTGNTMASVALGAPLEPQKDES